MSSFGNTVGVLTPAAAEAFWQNLSIEDKVNQLHISQQQLMRLLVALRVQQDGSLVLRKNMRVAPGADIEMT